MADCCQPNPNQLHFLMCKVGDLECECQRLHRINGRLLDEVVQLKVAYQDAIGGRQFVLDDDQSIELFIEIGGCLQAY